jgi:DNA repair protein RecO (recombination protein O)
MIATVTRGIVLSRTEFGEADRIITFLTPDKGKVGAIAKGVRKSKSKLAGGIELFSVSDISYIVGRGQVSTLISSRLLKHYGKIVKDLERTQAGFEAIMLINKATEDQPEEAYFHLLEQVFKALEDFDISTEVVRLWTNMQVLKLAGHTPNLHTDNEGKKLQKEHTYDFEFDGMNFKPVDRSGSGSFSAEHIQFLRLGFGNNSAKALQRIKGIDKLTEDSQPLVRTMLSNYVRI